MATGAKAGKETTKKCTAAVLLRFPSELGSAEQHTWQMQKKIGEDVRDDRSQHGQLLR